MSNRVNNIWGAAIIILIVLKYSGHLLTNIIRRMNKLQHKTYQTLIKSILTQKLKFYFYDVYTPTKLLLII